MASLTVRDIPGDVMRKLREAAAEQRRSVNGQVIHWLEEAARKRASRQDLGRLITEIHGAREAMRRRHGRGTDSAVLIRRMRDERTAHLLGLVKNKRGKTARGRNR